MNDWVKVFLYPTNTPNLMATVETWPPIQTCLLLGEFPQIWPLAGREKPAWDLGVADTETSGQLLQGEPLRAPSSIHHPLSS